jgi:hypothetical protein
MICTSAAEVRDEASSASVRTSFKSPPRVTSTTLRTARRAPTHTPGTTDTSGKR